MQEMQEKQVQLWGQEDPLDEEMASSILPWEIPQTEEPGGLESMGLQKSQTRLSAHTHARSNSRRIGCFSCSLLPLTPKKSY